MSERCLRMWYLSMGKLDECRSRKGRLNVWRLSRWTICKSRLSHHRLKEGSLKLNTPSLWGSLYLEWGNVKLGSSLLIATLRIYSTLHISNICLILNSRMCMSLSSGLCWCFICFSHPRAIWGLLKFHHPHGLIIICTICIRSLKIRLSTQVNANILEYSGKEAALGKYTSHALAAWNHVHHHQISQMDPFFNHNGIYKECLIIRDLISMSTMW